MIICFSRPWAFSSVIIIFFFCFFPKTCITAPQKEQNKIEASGQKLQAFLTQYPKIIESQIRDPEQGGIFLSAVHFPMAGRFVNGEGSCSGALIAPRYFLTAAHCVCGEALTYKECNERITETSKKDNPTNTDAIDPFVFLPAAGVFRTIGVPNVNPKYRKPKLGEAGELADLAIITISESLNIPILPIKVKRKNIINRYIAASFGKVAFNSSNQALELNFPVHTQFSEGLGTISVIKTSRCKVSYSDSQCGYFGYYNNDEKESAACKGDSGGLLLGENKYGEYLVEGVTALFDSSDKACTADTERLTYYTLIQEHLAWIEKVVGKDSLDGIRTQGSRLNCLEGYYNPKDSNTITSLPLLIEPHNVVSITRSGASKDNMPTIKLIGIDAKNCENMVDQYNFISCHVEKKGTIFLETKGLGIIQMSICNNLEPTIKPRRKKNGQSS